jgi:3-oxoacyl-(acyl-carrier-protein) synthase
LDAREVGTRTGADPDRLARLDPFSALVVAACAEVLGRGCLPSDRVAVVVGTASATLEENERFDARRRRRGAQAVEPRRFPATSPNLCAGHASIVYGLKGPAFAVGGGLEAPLEALLAGADLVASGDADYAVVVVADDSGPVVADVWDAAGWVRPARGAAAALLSARAGSPLRRERLMELSRQVAAEGGCLFGAEPGWPVLLAALEGAV